MQASVRQRGAIYLRRVRDDEGINRWLTSAFSTTSGKEEEHNGDKKIDFGFQEVPREEKQSLVGKVFSNVAPSYDVMNDLMSGGLHRLWKDRLVESLAPFAGMRHLDVAGGTGDVAFRVFDAIRDAERLRDAAASPSSTGSRSDHPEVTPSIPSKGKPYCPKIDAEVGSVVVCDINASMLKEGEKKAAARGIDLASIQWVEGNAEELPFDDNTFDSYTIAFGIRNVTDRQTALCEARRVLRPGGRFLCLEFSKVVVPGLQQLYDMYSFNVIPEIGRVVAGDAESYRYLVESIRMFPSQEEFAEMIRTAGFSAVQFENLTAGVVALHSGVKGG